MRLGATAFNERKKSAISNHSTKTQYIFVDGLFDESDKKFLNDCPDFLDKNQELGLMS